MTSNVPRTIAILILLMLTLVGAWYWRQRPAALPIHSASSAAVPAKAEDARSSMRRGATASTSQQIASPNIIDAARAPGLPASLQGTTPDGEVTLNTQGRILPTLGLRRLFDYFLSAIGELDVPAIRALLIAHVQGLHGDIVANEVGRIFDHYVDYQRALGDAEPQLSSDLDARLAFAKELRRKFFDAASADAFFGDEEAYADYTLERMRIARDASLDEAARAGQLRALEQTLSSEQRAGQQETSSAVLAEEQSRQFEAIGASPDERQAERSALFGEEAANRLADLDRQRSAWGQRVAIYQQARNAITSDSRYSVAQRQRLIGELRASSFDHNEARRIAALESIGKL